MVTSGRVVVDDLSSSPAAAEGAPLGLHEELWHPGADGPATGGCICGPVGLRLRSEHGELVRPRGGCVNRCDHCAKLAAIENCEMLALDAVEGDAPAVLLVLGTRTAFPEIPGDCECDDLQGAWRPGDDAPDVCERCALSRGQMAGFYKGLKLVKRALRRKWPAVEYASLLEFTTGYGPRSGGQRRPHWNLLLKGIPAADAAPALETAARVWCQHVDAEPAAQHGRSIYSADGLFRYLALHFQKASQTPPAGFTGQRFNCSRAYFTGCTRATARARAHESLSMKREVWRAERATDAAGELLHADAYDVELAAQLSYRRACATRWALATASGSMLAPVFHAPLVERLRSQDVKRAHGAAIAREELLYPTWLVDTGALFGAGSDDRYT